MQPAMKTLVTDNLPLLRLIARFHGQPSSLIHADRWPKEVSPAVRKLLQGNPNGERRLANFISDYWSLDGSFRYTFEPVSHRLALLTPSDLGKLATYCSAAAHFESIVRNIDKVTQTAYREALGSSPFEFAIKRATFVARSLPDHWRLSPNGATAIRTSVRDTGRNMIFACLGDAPEEIRSRMALAFEDEETPQNTVPTPQTALWPVVKRILLTEVNPGLQPCFN